MEDITPPITFLPASLKCKASQFNMKHVTLVFTWKYINTHTTDI